MKNSTDYGGSYRLNLGHQRVLGLTRERMAALSHDVLEDQLNMLPVTATSDHVC